MSIAPPGGQDRIMTTVRKATAPTSSSFAWQTASRWRPGESRAEVPMKDAQAGA